MWFDLGSDASLVVGVVTVRVVTAFATVLQRSLVTDLTITASVARVLSQPRDYYESWL
jgi:hypothetical protein